MNSLKDGAAQGFEAWRENRAALSPEYTGCSAKCSIYRRFPVTGWMLATPNNDVSPTSAEGQKEKPRSPA